LPSEETTPPVMKMYRAMDLQNTSNAPESKSFFSSPSTAFPAPPADAAHPAPAAPARVVEELYAQHAGHRFGASDRHTA
jgi:hypothetical protein